MAMAIKMRSNHSFVPPPPQKVRCGRVRVSHSSAQTQLLPPALLYIATPDDILG